MWLQLSVDFWIIRSAQQIVNTNIKEIGKNQKGFGWRDPFPGFVFRN